jgi:hypothetical protein
LISCAQSLPAGAASGLGRQAGVYEGRRRKRVALALL